MQEIKKFYQDFFFHSQSIGSRFFYQKSSFCLRAQGEKLGVVRQVPGTVEHELKVGDGESGQQHIPQVTEHYKSKLWITDLCCCCRIESFKLKDCLLFFFFLFFFCFFLFFCWPQRIAIRSQKSMFMLAFEEREHPSCEMQTASGS